MRGSSEVIDLFVERVDDRDLGLGVLGNPLSDFLGLPILLRALERRGIGAEIIPGMPRATLSASITMPLVPLPPGSTHHTWDDLVEIMARLRRSCPWDREQTHASLVRYLIEETYEVVDAIEHGNDVELCEELGDLLFQIVFHSQLATERGTLLRRRRDRRALEQDDPPPPARVRRRRRRGRRRGVGELGAAQVGRGRRARSARRSSTASRSTWRRCSAARRCRKKRPASASTGPMRATSPRSSSEELRELAEARLRAGDLKPEDPHVREELGDVMFTVVNLARRLGIDAEGAMRDANDKFERRFRYMEAYAIAGGRQLNDMTLDELEDLWQQAKTAA